jgi:hypothetical protein
MARGEIPEIHAEVVGPFGEKAELELAIAYDARIWRPARKVFVSEIVEDPRFVFRAQIDGPVFDAEPLAELFAGGDILGLIGAVAGLFGPRRDRDRSAPYFHGQAENRITALDQEGGGHCRVHASGKADRDSLLFTHGT